MISLSLSVDRRLAAAAAAFSLLVLSGCPEPIPEPACGDLRSFDLSACNRTTLNQVYLGGIFNTEIAWNGGGRSEAAIYTVVQGGERIDGHPATSKTINSNTLYFAAAYAEGGSQRRLAFAGCEAQSVFHVTGLVQSCVDGVKVDEGTFEANWVDWGDNESASQNVAVLSETPLKKGTAADVWVDGRWAYVAARTGGLAIYDVTTASAPLLTATVEEAGDDWRDAKVVGNAVYIASQKHGVIIYDVTNPAAPVRVGQVPSDDIQVRSVEIDPGANRLYASSPSPNGEVLIWDVSTPTSPQLQSRTPLADPRGISLFNGRMFVNAGAQGLVSFDLPPVQRGVFGPPPPGEASASSQAGLFGGKTVAFESTEGWNGHLRAVDFTDPSAPVQLGEWSNGRPQQSMGHVQLVGTKLYVAHYQSGLRILDVSNPAAPVQTGYFNTWRLFDAGRGNTFFDSAMGVRVPGDGNIYLAESVRGLMVFGETGP